MTKQLLVLVCLVLCSIPVASQQPIDQRETFFDGQYFFFLEDYREAVFHYRRLYPYQKTNASLNYKIGYSYLNIPGQKHLSIPFLEEAVKSTTSSYKPRSFRASEAPHEAFLQLARAYRINKQLDQAAAMLDEYEKLSSPRNMQRRNLLVREREILANAGKQLNNPADVRITNLGEAFNTGDDEFNPAVSGDGLSMVFMRKLRFYDAFMYSRFENGAWTTPVEITGQLGSDGNHYVSSLNYDGTEMYVVVGDQYVSNIHLSRLKDGMWSNLELLNRNINNSRGREAHASVSKDGLSLFFTSNRVGGLGGLDIYRSDLMPGGDWGPAVNLGPVINTPYDDMSPFLTEDGSLLYFSSGGHDTMGETDIFFSLRGAEGSWMPPENLGYPVNTTDDDMFFVPLKNGQEGYISRFSNDGFGGSDIWFVQFTGLSEEKEIPTITPVEFQEINRRHHTRIVDTLETRLVLVSVIDESNRKTEYLVYPGPQMQEESPVPMPKPRVQELRVSEGAIFFEFNQAGINRFAAYELEKKISLLKEFPAIELEIIGHTCSMGNEQVNRSMSIRRALAAAEYMTGRGIEPSRLHTRGEGSSKPVAINKNTDGSDNPRGRSYNQRAEFRILSPGFDFILFQEVFVPEELRLQKN